MIMVWSTLCYLALGQETAPAVREVTRPAVIQDYTFEEKDDLDQDQQPDDWTRRRGQGFPIYLRASIDDKIGHNSNQSLRFDANGAQALYYSPPIRIDPRYAIILEGYVRSDRLEDTAGMLSVSLLDQKRRRISRHLSAPVTATQSEWVRVEIGPLLPGPEIRHAVIGCHLLPGEQVEIAGRMHFDDLRLGRLPRLSLDHGFMSHFHDELLPLTVQARISGLDAQDDYQLQFQLTSTEGEPPLSATLPITVSPDSAASDQLIDWQLPQQKAGFYRASASLVCNGQIRMTRETTLAVMPLHDLAATDGGFGWSLGRHDQVVTWESLPDLAAQSGVNWIKLPVWSSSSGLDPERTTRIHRLLDKMTARGVNVVGVLDEPPAALRNRLELADIRTSEVLTLSRDNWAPTVHPVIARYGATMRYWQIGDDADTTLANVPELSAVLGQVHREITGVGRRSRLVLPWEQTMFTPSRLNSSLSALSLTDRRGGADPNAVQPSIQSTRKAGYAAWVTLWPDRLAGATPADRAATLVRSMLAARIGGAEAVFLGDIMNPESGLLSEAGAPTELYLPWRTAALALQGAEYLGEIVFPGESRSAVFARGDEAILFVWGREPTTERLFLGGEPYEVDLWGRRRPLEWNSALQESEIPVETAPKIIRGGLAQIARWRVAAQFATGAMKSEYGWHDDEIVGKNTFAQGVSGRVQIKLPKEWEAQPVEWPLQVAAGQPYRLPASLMLPTSAQLGEARIMLDYEITADQTYKFRVHQKYQVGLGDVTIEVVDRRLPDGRLEIEQVVKNKTDPAEVLDFRCTLFVPKARRQRFAVTQLGLGQDRKLYHLLNADALRGQELWLRLEQEGGRRILNHRWIVGKDW